MCRDFIVDKKVAKYLLNPHEQSLVKGEEKELQDEKKYIVVEKGRICWVSTQWARRKEEDMSQMESLVEEDEGLKEECRSIVSSIQGTWDVLLYQDSPGDRQVKGNGEGG